MPKIPQDFLQQEVQIDRSKALVLFSGGQDSATCLMWALDQFDHVETIGFDYRQRHLVELDVREEFLLLLRQDFAAWKSKLGDDHLIDLGGLASLGDTAMTHEVEFKANEDGLPNTFVPGRNIVFFTFAAALAYRRGCKHVVAGMCETDYSGYPDCRDDTIKSLQATLNLGMDARFVLHTPLMWVDKAETWQLAKNLGGDTAVKLITRSTHSCYLGDRSELKDWGYGCGNCPACVLRKNGWDKFQNSLHPVKR